jgi:hypothetical protein
MSLIFVWIVDNTSMRTIRSTLRDILTRGNGDVPFGMNYVGYHMNQQNNYYVHPVIEGCLTCLVAAFLIGFGIFLFFVGSGM